MGNGYSGENSGFNMNTVPQKLLFGLICEQIIQDSHMFLKGFLLVVAELSSLTSFKGVYVTS